MRFWLLTPFCTSNPQPNGLHDNTSPTLQVTRYGIKTNLLL